jgi:hypothetical protein
MYKGSWQLLTNYTANTDLLSFGLEYLIHLDEFLDAEFPMNHEAIIFGSQDDANHNM